MYGKESFEVKEQKFLVEIHSFSLLKCLSQAEQEVLDILDAHVRSFVDNDRPRISSYIQLIRENLRSFIPSWRYTDIYLRKM